MYGAAARGLSGKSRCGGHCLYLDRPDLIYFAGGQITAWGSTRHMGMSQPDGPTYTTVNDTEWITGYALFVTRAGFEQVGLFDERFFLLFEDSDWSLRARRLGYRLRYVGTAQLWHRASVSFGGNHSPLYHYYFTRNKLLWLERHYPLHQFLWLAARFLRHTWSSSDRTAYTTQAGRTCRRAILWGVRDYLGRRFGQGQLAKLGGNVG